MPRLKKDKYLKLGISRKLRPSVGRRIPKHAGRRKTMRSIMAIKITSMPIRETSLYKAIQ